MRRRNMFSMLALLILGLFVASCGVSMTSSKVGDSGYTYYGDNYKVDSKKDRLADKGYSCPKSTIVITNNSDHTYTFQLDSVSYEVSPARNFVDRMFGHNELTVLVDTGEHIVQDHADHILLDCLPCYEYSHSYP